MKNNLITLLIIILTVTFGCSSTGSLSKEEKAKVEAQQLIRVKALVESGTYIFTAQSAQATGGKNIQLNSSSYTLDSKDHFVKADLPFFGRGYTSHYANDPGIKFEGEPEDLSLNENEQKNSINIQYRISKSNDSYDITLTISSSSYGTLTVISRNRQAISYYGYIKEMPEDYKF